MGKLSVLDRPLAELDKQIAELQRRKDYLLSLRPQKPKARATRSKTAPQKMREDAAQG